MPLYPLIFWVRDERRKLGKTPFTKTPLDYSPLQRNIPNISLVRFPPTISGKKNEGLKIRSNLQSIQTQIKNISTLVEGDGWNLKMEGSLRANGKQLTMYLLIWRGPINFRIGPKAKEYLLEQIPSHTKRILDLGTGDGRLLSLVKMSRPDAEGVALDFSDPMLERARKRFADDKNVTVVKHDFGSPLPAKQLGCFDAVVSSLAIHHLTHPRKKQLYTEIFNLSKSEGVFCNLEQLLRSTQNLHLKFVVATG